MPAHLNKQRKSLRQRPGPSCCRRHSPVADTAAVDIAYRPEDHSILLVAAHSFVHTGRNLDLAVVVPIDPVVGHSLGCSWPDRRRSVAPEEGTSDIVVEDPEERRTCCGRPSW